MCSHILLRLLRQKPSLRLSRMPESEAVRAEIVEVEKKKREKTSKQLFKQLLESTKNQEETADADNEKSSRKKKSTKRKKSENNEDDEEKDNDEPLGRKRNIRKKKRVNNDNEEDMSKNHGYSILAIMFE